MRSEVLTAVHVVTAFFWDVTPCSWVGSYVSNECFASFLIWLAIGLSETIVSSNSHDPSWHCTVTVVLAVHYTWGKQ